MRILVRSAAALACIVSPALSQTSPCITPFPGGDIPFGPGPPVPIDRIVIGDYDADLAGDVLVLQDGTVSYVPKAQLYEHAVPVEFPGGVAPSGVVGLASFDDMGPDGRDSILMTNPSGMLWTSVTDTGFQAPMILDTESWRSAGPIYSANLDAVAGTDIYGINSAQTHVIRMVHAGGIQFTGISALQPDGQQPLVDAVALDWVAGGSLEMAILATDGLYVLDHSGNELFFEGFPAASSPSAIAALDLAAPAQGQLVAWTRKTGPTNAELCIRGANTNDNATIALGFDPAYPSCPAGSFVPNGLSSGNYDGDQHQDLLLSAPGFEAVALRSSGSAPWFTPGNAATYDVINFGQTYGRIAVGQLDDGPDDLAVPITLTGEMEVYVDIPYLRAINAEPSSTGSVVQDFSEYKAPRLENGVTSEGFRLALSIPPQYVDRDHVELVVWREPLANSVANNTLLDGEHHGVYQLVQDQTTFESVPEQWILVDEMQWTPSECDPGANGDPISKWDPVLDEAYYLEFRFVDYDTTNGVSNPTRLFNVGFTFRTDCNLFATNPQGFVSYPSLQGATEKGVYESDELLGIAILPPGQKPPAVKVGAFIPFDGSPTFPTGGLPRPGTIEVDSDARPTPSGLLGQ